MARTRALVHLGPIKTGTTALSRYFTLLGDAGKTPSSVCYPMGDLWFGLGGNIVRQRYQLEALMSRRDSPFADVHASQPGSELDNALARVASSMTQSSETRVTAVFVVETGLPRFDPATLDEILRRHFDDVDYLFMARRQDKLVSSIVAQNMKMWEKRWATLNPRWELAKLPRLKDFRALDYAAQFDRWARVVGPTRVIVVPYDEGDQGSFATIDRIFDFADLGRAPRIDGIEGLRIHPTFSSAGMNDLAWVKSVARWTWWFRPFRTRLNIAWEARFHRYHGQAIDGVPDEGESAFRPWTLSSDDRRWVMKRFAGSNRRLRETQHAHDSEWDDWMTSVEEAAQ